MWRWRVRMLLERESRDCKTESVSFSHLFLIKKTRNAYWYSFIRTSAELVLNTSQRRWQASSRQRHRQRTAACRGKPPAPNYQPSRPLSSSSTNQPARVLCTVLLCWYPRPPTCCLHCAPRQVLHAFVWLGACVRVNVCQLK